MDRIVRLVHEECAGDVIRKRASDGKFSVEELGAKVDRNARSIWPVYGIVEERRMCAMLTIFLDHLEITRIEVDERHRRRGVMRDFVQRLATVSRERGLSLVMGCVESDVMRSIMERDPKNREHRKHRWIKCCDSDGDDPLCLSPSYVLSSTMRGRREGSSQSQCQESGGNASMLLTLFR